MPPWNAQRIWTHRSYESGLLSLLKKLSTIRVNRSSDLRTRDI